MRKRQSDSSRSDEGMKPSHYVLDSYALLAYFENEEGAAIVTELIEGTIEGVSLFLSLINFGEVAYISERERGREEAMDMLEDIRRLPIVLCGVDERRVLAAAHIKAGYPISYADAFTVALAQELGATIVTGDPEFKKVEDLVAMLWLRTV